MDVVLKTEKSVDIYQKALFVILSLFIVSLPFKSSINSIFLIGLSVLFFFKKDLKAYVRQQLQVKRILLFSVFYLLHVFSFFNSANSAAAGKEIVLKIPFLILPFIIGSISWNWKKFRFIMLLFIVVVLGASLYSFGLTYYRIFKPDLYDTQALLAHDWAYFSYILPQSINFHPPYYSLYIATALLLVYYLAFSRPQKRKGLSKGIGLLLIAYFSFFMALLSSRTCLVATVMVMALWVTFDLYRKGYLKVLLVFWTLLLALLFVAYFSFPYLRGKFENKSGVSIRSQIWNGSWQVIKENPVVGVGTGDIKAHLKAAYQQQGFTEGVSQMYNTHNQFLQTTVALGVFGLMGLLLCFASAGWEAFKNSDKLGLSFLLIFIFCCLTEALLSRQHGIALFCFFTSFFPLCARNKA